MQLAVSKVLDLTSDFSVYEKNRNLLYECLTDCGFEVVKPEGTFYIFPKAPEADAAAFCQKALQYDLVLVPADSFGCPGYFRMHRYGEGGAFPAGAAQNDERNLWLNGKP